MPVQPSGLVAFLLTDVEGSTLLWETEPVAMAEAMNRHDEVLDRAVRAHDGQRPVDQGEGDSMVAVFATASDALAAALDAQRWLLRERWPTTHPLRVRMALHAGEAIVRDGNYKGEAIARCARIRSCGHGGQVLASQALVDIVGALVPPAAGFVSLGSHRLRDLGQPEHVLQLTHPELPVEFAPLRSLELFRHNLPSPRTPLIGRKEERREVLGLIDRHALVSLLGAGGVGKTRLAASVGAEVVERFEGGVWWVDLSPLREPSALTAAVLSAAGGREGLGVGVVDQLVALLRKRDALVILDNCEHLVDECARLVAELLARCPGVSILATSREPLSVQSEVTWTVPSLPAADAADLFVERARRARPSLVIEEAEAEAIDQICARLDGVPLAIELAAARCRNLSPANVAAGLHDRFRLLTGGARVGMPHHRTLLASVQWSYQLLSSDEQRAFRCLAVFRGQFDLAAASAVLADVVGLDALEAVDAVDRLVDRSVVSTNDGEGFRLLETMREFALAELGTVGEVERANRAHCRHYAAWAASLELDDDPNVYPAVRSAYPNLLAALHWATGAQRGEIVALLRGCAWVWRHDNRFDDLRTVALGQVLPLLAEVDEAAWVAAVVAIAEPLLAASFPAALAEYFPALGERSARLGIATGRATYEMLIGRIAVDTDRLVLATKLAEEGGSPSIASAAMGHVGLASARRGEVGAALAVMDRVDRPPPRGVTQRLVWANARLRAAMEAGGLDEALRHASEEYDELWNSGLRDTVLHASLGGTIFSASILAQNDKAMRRIVSVGDDVADAMRGPLGDLILRITSKGLDAMDGTLEDVEDWITDIDSAGFGAERRVELIPALLGSGLHDEALRLLEPLRQRHPEWPLVQISAALLDGLDRRDPAILVNGLALAARHRCSTSAVDLLEAFAVVALAGGDADLAAFLGGACAAQREALGVYRLRYRHLDALEEVRGTSRWVAGIGAPFAMAARTATAARSFTA